MTVSYQATVNNPVPSGQTQVVNTASVTSVEIVTPVQATVTDNILTALITLTLRKRWTNASLNDAVDVTAAVGGVTIDTLSSTANTANETDTDATPVNVTAGQVITFAETFTTGDAANYTSSLACTGATDVDLADGLTVNAADTAIVCTETNTRKTATLTLQKTWVDAAPGDRTTISLTATNNDSLISTADTPGETDTDATPTTVYAGETVTLGEAFSGLNTQWYDRTLDCIGATDSDLTGGDLTIDPADTTITCTFTNTVIPFSPTIVKSFSPNPIAAFGTSTLTFVITNPNPGAALSGVAFVDNYPGGLVNMNPVSTTNTCGGSLTALSDDDFIQLTGGSIPGGRQLHDHSAGHGTECRNACQHNRECLLHQRWDREHSHGDPGRDECGQIRGGDLGAILLRDGCGHRGSCTLSACRRSAGGHDHESADAGSHRSQPGVHE